MEMWVNQRPFLFSMWKYVYSSGKAKSSLLNICCSITVFVAPLLTETYLHRGGTFTTHTRKYHGSVWGRDMESLSQPLAPGREGGTVSAEATTAHTCFTMATFSQSSDPSLSESSWSPLLVHLSIFHGKKEGEFWSRICQCLPSS